jgi:hypothetical protein
MKQLLSKKVTIIIIMVVVLAQLSFSQDNNDPQWSRNGNNTGPSGSQAHTFGTFFNQPINIFTNGTQKATFLPNGNFGIGTTAPGTLFTVSGAMPQVELVNSTAGGESSIFYNANMSGKPNWYVGHNENSIGAGNFGFFSTQVGQVLTMLGTNGFTGIGTSIPQNLLHLHNAKAPTHTQQQINYAQFTIDAGSGTGSTANDGFKIGVRTFWNTALTTPAYESHAELRQQENAAMDFYTGNGTANHQRMTIGANGNIGIGLDFTSPQAMLHIHDGNHSSFQMSNGAITATLGVFA